MLCTPLRPLHCPFRGSRVQVRCWRQLEAWGRADPLVLLVRVIPTLTAWPWMTTFSALCRATAAVQLALAAELRAHVPVRMPGNSSVPGGWRAVINKPGVGDIPRACGPGMQVSVTGEEKRAGRLKPSAAHVQLHSNSCAGAQAGRCTAQWNASAARLSWSVRLPS